MNEVSGTEVYLISGVDSGVGKTVATGLLLRWFRERGRRAISLKLVDHLPGGLSRDVAEHRRLANMELQEEDALGLTCLCSLDRSGPASAPFERNLAGLTQDRIERSMNQLGARYEVLLIEGEAGPLMPLDRRSSTADLAGRWDWPVVLVAGPQPATVNHVLAAVEVLGNRDIRVQGLVYNLGTEETFGSALAESVREWLVDRLADHGLSGRICDIPGVSCTPSYCIDFAPLFTEKEG